jgi:hypothetical protein
MTGQPGNLQLLLQDGARSTLTQQEVSHGRAPTFLPSRPRLALRIEWDSRTVAAQIPILLRMAPPTRRQRGRLMTACVG